MINQDYAPQNNFSQIQQATNPYGFKPMQRFMGPNDSGMMRPQVQQQKMPSYGPSNGTAIGSAQNGNAQQFIQNWQSQNQVGAPNLSGLVSGLQSAGFNANPYMYGSTPSNNEISLNNQKYKILGGEGTPAAYWYQPGMNDQGSQQQMGQSVGPAYLGSHPQMMNQQMMQPMRNMNTSLAMPGQFGMGNYGPQNQQTDISSLLGRNY